MKPSLLLVLPAAFASKAAAGSATAFATGAAGLAAEPSSTTSSTTIDTCSASLLATDGMPALSSRLIDCSILNVVTVTPKTITSVIVMPVATVDSTSYTGTTTITTTSPAVPGKRDGMTATGADGGVTVSPTSVPAYATYCDSSEEYYSACSEAGITASTDTQPAPTTRTTTTTTITCYASYLFTQYIGVPFPTQMALFRW